MAGGGGGRGALRAPPRKEKNRVKIYQFSFGTHKQSLRTLAVVSVALMDPGDIAAAPAARKDSELADALHEVEAETSCRGSKMQVSSALVFEGVEGVADIAASTAPPARASSPEVCCSGGCSPRGNTRVA